MLLRPTAVSPVRPSWAGQPPPGTRPPQRGRRPGKPLGRSHWPLTNFVGFVGPSHRIDRSAHLPQCCPCCVSPALRFALVDAGDPRLHVAGVHGVGAETSDGLVRPHPERGERPQQPPSRHRCIGAQSRGQAPRFSQHQCQGCRVCVSHRVRHPGGDDRLCFVCTPGGEGFSCFSEATSGRYRPLAPLWEEGRKVPGLCDTSTPTSLRDGLRRDYGPGFHFAPP